MGENRGVVIKKCSINYVSYFIQQHNLDIDCKIKYKADINLQNGNFLSGNHTFSWSFYLLSLTGHTCSISPYSQILRVISGIFNKSVESRN